MSHADRAVITYQKNCQIILRDSGNKEVASVDACFTKIKNQFPGKISYGLVADLVLKGSKKRKGLVITNTTKASEDSKSIKIDLLSGSPELFQFTHTRLEFDKQSETLSIHQNKRRYWSSFKNHYNLLLQCK
ncbi:MAG: hypothetical protein HN509_03640 [Halobacteriovoraceae bacterium]|jgi:hypothetical protein|nr:hypothetical protein [Halobacteriovoraceae bacterium]